MTWKLSRFAAGDLVEVRTKEQILATLDRHGCLEGLPFMPEMLRFCGRQFRVRAVAHKTCDTERKMGTARRLDSTVHLGHMRCDGSAHGGCQAECTLFWKDAWLKQVNERPSGKKPSAALPTACCTEAQLMASTIVPTTSADAQPCYACQATKLFDATELLPWWDVRQYVFDVWTGNHSLGRVLRVTLLGLMRWVLPRVPFGYRLSKAFTDLMHRLLTGRPAPQLECKFKRGEATPTGRLYLKPGEYVRIKAQKEIEQTIDGSGRNRGLSFDPEEMAPYCGKIFRVRNSVTQIIDEPTGKMRQMKQPCIILEGVVCNSEYAGCRLNCPRAIPAYWREIWLERVAVEGPAWEALMPEKTAAYSGTEKGAVVLS